MNELTVGILGLGEIGRKTATLFKGLGSKVVGLVNSPRSGDQTVDRYYVGGELPEMLSSCHYIINILPSTKCLQECWIRQHWTGKRVLRTRYY